MVVFACGFARVGNGGLDKHKALCYNHRSNGLSCPKRKVRANMSVRGLVTVVIGVVAFVVIDSLDMLWGLRRATCGQALR